MKTAANKYAGNCVRCAKRTEAGEGVYLKRAVLCGPCLQTCMDDMATKGNKGKMVHPIGIPSRLVAWAGRENGLVGVDRMKALAKEFTMKRLMGELFAPLSEGTPS